MVPQTRYDSYVDRSRPSTSHHSRHLQTILAAEQSGLLALQRSVGNAVVNAVLGNVVGNTHITGADPISIQRKPAAGKTTTKPPIPKLGKCTPAKDDVKPSAPWSELQKRYRKSCESTVEKGLDQLLSGKLPTSAADAKGAIDCVCAFASPEDAAEAAKIRVGIAGPLASQLYQHFLDGKGTDWTIDVKDMIVRDPGVCKKIYSAMGSSATTGTTRVEQSDYSLDDFRFAYGAIDCVQWIMAPGKRTYWSPVRIAMLDYYEFHPARPGVSQCAHAACVELVARGSAKNFWTRGTATVPWGWIKP